MIPGPVVLVFGLIYMLILIGPWALIAMGTYGAFYPFMVSPFEPFHEKGAVELCMTQEGQRNRSLPEAASSSIYCGSKSF